MPEITDFEIAETMRRYGGSFVSALGTAFQRADSVNQATLKAAFPEYWAKYRDLAVLKQEREHV